MHEAKLVSPGQDLLNAPPSAFRESIMPAAKTYEAIHVESEGGMFLDEKSYRPGYGHFKRKRASA
jgi:hypothetical protein